MWFWEKRGLWYGFFFLKPGFLEIVIHLLHLLFLISITSTNRVINQTRLLKWRCTAEKCYFSPELSNPWPLPLILSGLQWKAIFPCQSPWSQTSLPSLGCSSMPFYLMGKWLGTLQNMRSKTVWPTRWVFYIINFSTFKTRSYYHYH